MIRGIVSRTITAILDEFMKPVKSSQMKMELIKGVTELRNLELQEKAFEKVGIPILVEQGIIGKLVLNFPWTKLESSPTVVQIEGIYLALKLDWDFIINTSTEMTSQKLRTDNAKPNTSLKSALGFLDKFADNLFVNIKNLYVSLTIEHDSGSATFGFVMPEFKIESSNNMKMGDRSFFSKVISMVGMYMFMDENFKNVILTAPEQFKKLLDKSNHSVIFDYPFLEVFYSHYRDTLTPIMNSIEGNLNEFSIKFTQAQIKLLSQISAYSSKALLKRKYVECIRPHENNEEKMLFYVMRCASLKIGHKRFSVSTATEFLKNRAQYYKLYSKNLDSQNIFTRNNAKKFDTFIASLSKPAKSLLLQYATAMRKVDMADKIHRLSEEEKRELEKQSESFMSTLKSFQMFGIINKFTISLLNNDMSEFSIFNLENFSVRGFISDVLQQYSIALQDMSVKVNNIDFMTVARKTSTWLSTTLTYGQDLATIQGTAGRLVFNLDGLTDFIKYFDGNVFKIKWVGFDYTPMLNKLYKLKKWDMTFDMDAISVQLKKLILELNLHMMNDDKQKSRKNEDVYLYNTSTLTIKNDDKFLMENMTSSFTFKSTMEKEFITSDVIMNVDNLIVSIDEKIIEFVFDYAEQILEVLHKPKTETQLKGNLLNLLVKNNKEFKFLLPKFRFVVFNIKNNLKNFMKLFVKELFNPKQMELEISDLDLCGLFIMDNLLITQNEEKMKINMGKLKLAAYSFILDFIPAPVQKLVVNIEKGIKPQLSFSTDSIKLLDEISEKEPKIASKHHKTERKRSSGTMSAESIKAILESNTLAQADSKLVAFDLSFVPPVEINIQEFILSWKNNENNFVFFDMIIPNINLNVVPRKMLFSLALPSFRIVCNEMDSFNISNINVFAALSDVDNIWSIQNQEDIYKFKFDSDDFHELDKITLFLSIANVDFIYDHQTAKTYVSYLNELMPSFKKFIPTEIEVKQVLPMDINMNLGKFTANIKDMEFGIDVNSLMFSLHDKQIKALLKGFQINQNKIKPSCFTHSDEYLLKIDMENNAPSIYLNEMTVTLHPAVYTPLLVYFWRTPFWKVSVPKVKTNIKVEQPELSLQTKKIRVLLPQQTDVGMTDEVLSVYVSAEVQSLSGTISCKTNVDDVRFVSLVKNFEFPQIIDHLSCFLDIYQPLKGKLRRSPTKQEKGSKPDRIFGVKTFSFGIDHDVVFSFCPEDAYGVYSILKDWLTVQIPAMNLQMSAPSSPPPCLFVTTKNIKVQFCQSNKNSSKEHPSLLILIPPIDIAASNLEGRTNFVAQTSFSLKHFNSCTGNLDSVIDDTELILSFTNTGERIDIVSLIDKPLSISLSYHLLREVMGLLAASIEPRHSHGIDMNPNFWLHSTCFDEIIVSVTGASTLFLFPGDLVPAFFIQSDSAIIVSINGRSTKLHPTDILYPVQLSENVVIAKHPYNGGMMLEFVTKYSIRNELSFDLYIYVKAKSGFVFLCVLPKKEIRSLLPYTGAYFFASSKEMPSTKPHLVVLGPEENVSKCEVFTTENYVPCIITKKKSDIFGFDILTISEEFTLKNLVPYAMHYNINGKKFLAMYGETIPIPSFGNVSYVSISASYDDTHYPSGGWLYFNRSEIQYFPAYVCKNVTLSAVVEDHTVIIYSPAVIFNSTSNILKFEDDVVHPGSFTLWAQKSITKIPVEIPERTVKVENIIDLSIPGSRQEFFLKNASNGLFTPLRYQSERQNGDFNRTIAITITDGLRVDNKLDYGIVLVPDCEESLSIDPMDFFVPKETMKIMKIISKDKKYNLRLSGDNIVRSIVLNKPRPKTVFRMLRDGKVEFIEIEVKDEVTSIFVTLRKVFQSRYVISNDLSFPISFYHVHENEKVDVGPNSFEDFAFEEPFGPKQIVFIIQEYKFFISLEDNTRIITLNRVFNQHKVSVYIKYVKGQCRISVVKDRPQIESTKTIARFEFAVQSIYLSILDELFRELICASFNCIDIIADLKDDLINTIVKCDNMTVDDQNPSASHPAILRSENKTFFDMTVIFPTDVLQSHEITYMSITMQPLHVYVVPQFLSDIYSFFGILNINQDFISIISPARSSFGITNEVKIAWCDINPIVICMSIINADKYKQLFPFVHLFSHFISLSERRFSLPAFFLTEFQGSLQEIANELTFVYAVNGLDYLLSNMGTVGSLLKFFGVVGRVKSLLNIEHNPFTSLPINLETENIYANRICWQGCFNNYTIENVFLAQSNFDIKNCLLTRIINSPNKDISVSMINSRAVIGLISESPHVNNHAVTMFRRRLPLCCLTNCISSYNERISMCQQIMIDKKIGRPMFMGVMQDNPSTIVFVTRNYVCSIDKDYKIEWAVPIIGVESILNDNDIITIHYARETKVIVSNHAGAIVLFISTN